MPTVFSKEIEPSAVDFKSSASSSSDNNQKAKTVKKILSVISINSLNKIILKGLSLMILNTVSFVQKPIKI